MNSDPEHQEQVALISADRFIEELTCAVCRDLYRDPRAIPECGHLLCTPCMQQLDDKETGRIVCPICRNQSISQIHERPISHNIRNIVEMNPNFSDEKKYPPVENCVLRELEFWKTVDVKSMAERIRKELAETVYIHGLPILIENARKGNCSVQIEYPDSRNAGDLISQLFFRRNNVLEVVFSGKDVFTLFLCGDIQRNSYYNNDVID